MNPSSLPGDRLEFIGLHLDPTAIQPWGAGVRPDEEVMRREEDERRTLNAELGSLNGEGGGGDGAGWGWLLEELMVFLFADARPEEVHLPALRAYALMRGVLPVMLSHPGRPVSWDGLTVGLLSRGFNLRDFERMIAEDAGWERSLRLILDYLYPPVGKGWLLHGTKILYVVARALNGRLVSREGELSRDRKRYLPEVELNFTEMARIFGEKINGAERARWSALAKRKVRDPIEAAGGVFEFGFGKRAGTRAKYREAQMGNTNRKGRNH